MKKIFFYWRCKTHAVAFDGVFFNISKFDTFTGFSNGGQVKVAGFSKKYWSEMQLSEKLRKINSSRIGLCVGLDPVFERIPIKFHNSKEPLYEFCKVVIEATSDVACAYKPNLAFFEAIGAKGWIQLEKTIQAIPKDKLVIADAKRGDIGNTAKAYSQALFSGLKADMATVSPYLGRDSLQPFIENPEHGIFALAVTSNPGGADLQDLLVDGQPLFIHVIKMVRSINSAGNVGIVVGATKSSVLSMVLEASVDLPLLIPGIGSQGGDVKALRNALVDYKAPVFVNSSRGIIYASSGEDFETAVNNAAKRQFAELNGD